MVVVKNLTNSPYDLETEGGFVRLPAFGEATGEFSGDYLQLLKASLAVDVTEEPAAPVDADDDIDALRAEYLELTGEEADGRWKVARLRSEIDKAKEA